jgi:hypothetical protein
MSDLDKAKDLLDQMKAATSGGSSKILSTKLLVTVGAALGMIWLAKANFALILWQLTLLLTTWLLCRTAHDIVLEVVKGKLKSHVLMAAMKDGQISDAEKTVIEEVIK